MKRSFLASLAMGALAGFGTAATAAPAPEAVLATYADIAAAAYEDALTEAQQLKTAVDQLVREPGAAAMAAARQAWLEARVPYQQTEVFRFGNAVVDDWEGKVNAWPLDEGLIDYVAAEYGTESDSNPLYTANIIANESVRLGTTTIDASRIDAELLQSLHEAGGVEANVGTGYHAIEFLLWGQDLNGTGSGAGERPWTDFAKGEACTNGNCDRRAAYLSAAAQLLVDDLAWIVEQWGESGAARTALTADGATRGIASTLTGIGSLSYGELAGERMKLGLLLNDPEEEHDCFSDNTHNSHYYNVVGMMNVWAGSYTRTDGRKVEGPGVSALVAADDAALEREMRAKLEASLAAFTALKQRAETKEAYDQMIGAGNAEGNAVIQAAIDALTDQTRSLERVVASLKLDPIAFEGSDSLDDPAKVFQ